MPEKKQKTTEKGYGFRWQKLRLTILDRDNYICQHCGCNLTKSGHVDHIIPKSLGGQDEDSNLQSLCFRCHDIKTKIEETTNESNRFIVVSDNSEWVKGNAKQGDLVLDQNILGMSLFDQDCKDDKDRLAIVKTVRGSIVQYLSMNKTEYRVYVIVQSVEEAERLGRLLKASVIDLTKQLMPFWGDHNNADGR